MTLDEILRLRSWSGGVGRLPLPVCAPRAPIASPPLAVHGLEIEIGCGNGHFLAEYAARHPQTLVVGVEIKSKRCRKAAEKVAKRGLTNAVILQRGAEGFVRELPRGHVEAFHIYFPDPWPKARHRKRRFFAMENLRHVRDALRPDGRLWFATDFFDYYLQAKVLLLAIGGFRLEPRPAPQEAFLSVYARKFAERPIHLLCAVRCCPKASDEEPADSEEDQPQVHGDGKSDEGR